MTIPGNVITIGKRAFADNYLNNVIITEGVITIGESAFAFNEITSITIPVSVEGIEKNAFGYNPLTSVIIEGAYLRFNDFWEYIGFPLELMP